MLSAQAEGPPADAGHLAGGAEARAKLPSAPVPPAIPQVGLQRCCSSPQPNSQDCAGAKKALLIFALTLWKISGKGNEIPVRNKSLFARDDKSRKVTGLGELICLLRIWWYFRWPQEAIFTISEMLFLVCDCRQYLQGCQVQLSHLTAPTQLTFTLPKLDAGQQSGCNDTSLLCWMQPQASDGGCPVLPTHICIPMALQAEIITRWWKDS